MGWVRALSFPSAERASADSLALSSLLRRIPSVHSRTSLFTSYPTLAASSLPLPFLLFLPLLSRSFLLVFLSPSLPLFTSSPLPSPLLLGSLASLGALAFLSSCSRSTRRSSSSPRLWLGSSDSRSSGTSAKIKKRLTSSPPCHRMIRRRRVGGCWTMRWGGSFSPSFLFLRAEGWARGLGLERGGEERTR